MKKEVYFGIGSPAIIWQIVFFYLPIILLFLTAFLKYTDDGDLLGFTFEHFFPFLTTSHLLTILFTLLFSTGTALICACIAYPVSYFIAFHAKKYRYPLLFLIILPFWTNFLLHVYAWFFILEPNGFLNQFLLLTGVISEPIHFFNTYFSIQLMMVYVYLPFMIMPIYSRLERFPKELIEASTDLGANWLQTFFYVLFPLTFPALRTGFFLVLIPAFGEFIIPELMGGDKYFFAGNIITNLILGDETGQLGAAFTFLCVIALSIALYLFVSFFELLSRKMDRRVA